MASESHRVVIVGGGFGGLFAARRLRRGPVRVTLVDRHNHHLFQPMLYQVATGILSEGEIAPPIRSVLHRQRNVEVELAEVTGFDLEARKVTATRPTGVPSRSLRQPDRRGRRRPVLLRSRRVLALGAGHEDDQRRPRASRPDPGRLRDGRARGGPGEATSGSPSWWSAAGRPAWRSPARSPSCRGGCSRTTSGDRSAQREDPALRRRQGGARPSATGSGKAARASSGSESSCTCRASSRTSIGPAWSSSRGRGAPDPARTKVWAAGVQASPGPDAGRGDRAEVDRAGRVSVLPDCTLPGHPEVFAIGT